MDYGNIPQNRERVYIVAFQDKNLFDKFKFPEPIVLTRKLKDVIQFDEKQDSKYYYTESSCNFYDKLKEYITNPDTIYQWRRIYVRA